MNDFFLMLSHFLKNPKEVGAIAPSSSFLAQEIVSSIDFSGSKNIVELGSGTGKFTRLILKNAGLSTKLICFEVNNKFCSILSKSIDDARMILINSGATTIKSNLKKMNLKEADCIVSGLPFKNFPESKQVEIITEVKNSLSKNGKFILFQYTKSLGKMLESNFKSVKRSFVPLNLPPAFVYVCEK